MDSIRLFLRRLEGLSIFLLAIAYCITLATYSPHDPSPDTWTSSPVIHNFFGRFGSALADVLWQSFGVASYLGALVLTAWAWVTCSERKLDLVLGRALATVLVFWAFGTLVAILAPSFPFFPSFVQGNAIGIVTKTGLEHLLPGLIGSIITALVMLAVGTSALHMAMGLVPEEWKSIWAFFAETAQTSTHFLIELFVHLSEKLHARFAGESSFSDEFDGPRQQRPTEGTEEEEDENALSDEEEEDEQEEGSFFSRLFSRSKRRGLPELDDEDAQEEELSDEEAPDDEGEEGEPRSVSKAKIVQRPQTTTKQARLALHSASPKAFPPLDLLQWPDTARQARPELSEEALEKNAKLLESVLADFGVYGQITKVSPGPVVTLYELEPSPGTRASRVISLADDIARNMSATAVRVAVVPGRNVIGIELPNKKREIVYLRELLSTDAYSDHAGALPIVLGKDIAGMPVIADLARMPHLLIAGTTGSGKSVAINTMILSLLYRLSPERCRFIMIDPKMLELSVYEGIPHLLAPVVTEPKKAIVALKWTVREMEERYRAMSKLGVRNIEGYNIRLGEAAKNNENLTRKVQTGYDKDTGKPIFEEQPLDLTPLPYIVVIVDEMADLMIVSGKEIESAVQRLAQMARAAGIHILMATQRPSVDVITGTIKANFPTRISFQVTSKIDSRTILGEQGAEQLLGQGDMLYMAGGGRVTRVHGPFVRDDEVESIVAFLKKQGAPDYLDAVTEDSDEENGDFSGMGSSGGSGEDSLYDQAVDLVLRERKASTSFIQRHLSIGYNKAATLIERMENENIISPANHVGKREVYGRKPDDDE